MWRYRGQHRPDFALSPGPGQESVWDYPRPPKLDPDHRLIEVFDGEVVIASTRAALRVLETASPPTFYLPPQDVNGDALQSAPGKSVCEWKGVASYWALSSEPRRGAVGWGYVEPRAAYEPLRDHIAFYPAALQCHVDGERVHPQPGRFYGGWVTAEVVGPFKGEPGAGHW